jgi:uncharacterized protein (DUF58 family)
VDGLNAGAHPGLRPGPGVEFHDYRPYAPGDDARALDWKVLGRTDRLYIRRHQRLAEMRVHLLIDCSRSMHFDGSAPHRNPSTDRQGPPTKLRVACELAACLAYLAVRQGDRVGLTLSTEPDRPAPPAQRGWPHLGRLCARLETVAPAASAPSLASALRRVTSSLASPSASLGQVNPGASGAGRGWLVILSDALDEVEPLLEAASRVKQSRLEATFIQVLTPLEMDLSPLGGDAARVVDSETRGVTPVDLSRAAAPYAELVRSHIDTLHRGLASLGLAHTLTLTDQPPAYTLRKLLNPRAAGASRWRLQG